jgi:hypothetical protein
VLFNKYILNRNNFKHVYANAKPVMEKANSEWENSKVYEAYIESCGTEAEENKAYVNWYACYTQMPLQ